MQGTPMTTPPADVPSQRTTGWRSVLSLAPAYRLAQSAIGAGRFRAALASEIVVAATGDRVLDLGCGTADIIEDLPEVDYLGFDPSERYVADAARRFGDRGRFVQTLPDPSGDRTIVLAIGVLHHTNPVEAAELLDLASASLAPGGRFIAVDPTLTDDQHPIARFLVSRDRGQHVRSPDQARELVAAHFASVEIEVRHDLLRPPYSHVIVRARNSLTDSSV
jgi:SAM-dependent methyltransferase